MIGKCDKCNCVLDYSEGYSFPIYPMRLCIVCGKEFLKLRDEYERKAVNKYLHFWDREQLNKRFVNDEEARPVG
jgi:hypothetical protein